MKKPSLLIRLLALVFFFGLLTLFVAFKGGVLGEAFRFIPSEEVSFPDTTSNDSIIAIPLKEDSTKVFVKYGYRKKTKMETADTVIGLDEIMTSSKSSIVYDPEDFRIDGEVMDKVVYLDVLSDSTISIRDFFEHRKKERMLMSTSKSFILIDDKSVLKSLQFLKSQKDTLR